VAVAKDIWWKVTDARQDAVLECVAIAKRYRDAYLEGQVDTWQTAPRAAEICSYMASVFDDCISDMEKLLVERVNHGSDH